MFCPQLHTYVCLCAGTAVNSQKKKIYIHTQEVEEADKIVHETNERTNEKCAPQQEAAAASVSQRYANANKPEKDDVEVARLRRQQQQQQQRRLLAMSS